MTEPPHVAGSRYVTTRDEPGALAADERRARGKALRERVPRELHAGWKPPSDRRDPIDLLIESNEGRLAGLVPIRFGRMLQSPFAFYRGAAVITPNRAELRQVVGRWRDESDLTDARRSCAPTWTSARCWSRARRRA